ncbi:3,4-dihydroxy-2-butanone-4-phosphate synthase [Mycolicibacterium vaccae]|uniref:3,4-dihydroxy-2-butanone-4-phosphate synthase n=1 Tax=Mycolicibacterium vaccae TaxID=1810 RepID=UPI003CF3BDE6
MSEMGAERIRRTRAAMAMGQPVAMSDGAETILVLLGSAATSAGIAQMVRLGSGLLFAAMSQDRLRELRIPPMPVDVHARTGRFHVAVDAAAGGGTGISATDRAHTIRLLSDPGSSIADFTRPGHVIPVAADIIPPHAPGHAELALALAGLVTDGELTAAYCALTSRRDPTSVAGPEEGQNLARQNGLAFIVRGDVLTAFYQAR